MRKNFKRALACLLAVIMCVCAMPIGEVGIAAQAADEFYYDGVFEYKIENDYAVFTGFTEKQSGTIFIPGILGGYPVKKIAKKDVYSFQGKLSGCKLVIPQGVESIGSYCFERAGISEIYIPKSIKAFYFCSFNYCSGLKVRYEGNEEDKENIYVEFGGIWAYDFYRAYEWVYNVSYDELYEEANIDKETGKEKQKKFPDGYDIYTSRWHFINTKQNINKEIYKKCFGTIQGTKLHFIYDSFDRKGGVCYGMASTASSYVAYPGWAKSFYVNEIEDYADNLINIDEDNYSYSLNMAAFTYIQFAHIYQFSDAISKARKDTAKDLEGLCQAVKNYVNGGTPLVIEFWHGSPFLKWGGHAVQAIGYEELDDSIKIYVYDSNEPYNFNSAIEIKKDFSEWNYSGGNLMWNSKNGFTTYNFPADIIYNMGISYGENKSDLYIQSKALITSNIPLTDETISEINPADTDEYDTSYNKDTFAYWLDSGHAYKFVSDEPNTVSISNGNLEIEVTTSATSEVTIDTSNINLVNCISTEGTDIKITISSPIDIDSILDLTISGTTSSDTVTATQTETGIVVTGLSNGTVTLSKDDEIISTQEIKGAISDIEITYDKDGETDEMDVDYETSQPEVCNCICHKGGKFYKVINKIVRVFWKLFKINQTCPCGQKHY